MDYRKTKKESLTIKHMSINDLHRNRQKWIDLHNSGSGILGIEKKSNHSTKGIERLDVDSLGVPGEKTPF